MTLEKFSRNRKKALTGKLISDCLLCNKCEKTLNTKNKVILRGSPNSNIFIITGLPTAEEGNISLPLSGSNLELLEKCLFEINLSVEEVYITPLIKCTPKSKKVTIKEIDNCSNFLNGQILTVKPSIIITLGKESFEYITGSKFLNQASEEEDYNYNINNIDIPVIGLEHPSWVIRSQNQKDYLKKWERIKEKI